MIFLSSSIKVLKFIFIGVLIFTLTTTTIRISPTKKEGVITYVAIGDSITEGLLENRELSVTNGYYGYVADALRNSGYDINAYNFAKSGATSPEILAQLHVVNQQLKTPDILTMSVGINDLIRHLRPIRTKKFQQEYQEAQQTVQQYSDSTTELPLAWKRIKKDINRMQKHITSMHLFFDTNQDIIDADSNAAKEIAATRDETEKVLADFNKAKISLLKKYDDLDENTTVVALAEEIKDIEKILTDFEDYITKQKKQAKKIHSSEGKQEDFKQYIELLTATESEIKNTVDKLNDFHETLSYIHVMHKQAVVAKKTIKVSKDKMESAFDSAFNEIETTKSNVEFIIYQAQSQYPDVEIFVLEYYNMLPYSSEGLQNKTVELITSLNESLEEVTKETDAVYVPSFEAFAEDYSTYLPNENNIHPGQDGYQTLAEQFIMKINESYPPINEGQKEKE